MDVITYPCHSLSYYIVIKEALAEKDLMRHISRLIVFVICDKLSSGSGELTGLVYLMCCQSFCDWDRGQNFLVDRTREIIWKCFSQKHNNLPSATMDKNSRPVLSITFQRLCEARTKRKSRFNVNVPHNSSCKSTTYLFNSQAKTHI